jgi:hypothetical protein
MADTSNASDLPNEQLKPEVPLVHEPPRRMVLTIVYDQDNPDYLVKLHQQTDQPDVQYSVQALTPIVAEALVGLIHAKAYYGYSDIPAALTQAIHLLEDGTFDAYAELGTPDNPGPTGDE